MTDTKADADLLLRLTTSIISSHVQGQALANCEILPLIRDVHRTLSDLRSTRMQDRPSPASGQLPPVALSASIRPDYLVCLEDGKKLKLLKRYLMTHFQLTPEAYRAKWGLPDDYPMVAPDYAAQRRELAIRNKLGRKLTSPRKGRLGRSLKHRAGTASPS